jgi:hypothetical protein
MEVKASAAIGRLSRKGGWRATGDRLHLWVPIFGRFIFLQRLGAPGLLHRSFFAVFIAVFLGTALIIAAIILHKARPEKQVQQPSAAMVKASGKCASCHRQETSAIVHQFELSEHAKKGVTCLDCHQVREGQAKLDHRGFEISKSLTAANCKQCHATEYRQLARSRHGAPAWAAVTGKEDFTKEQVAFAEQYHPGAVDRPANTLAQIEGEAAMTSGCKKCHSIGKPNPDGTIGSCTACHSRHNASVELARTPETCGQCHMGPDHAQIEIYHESKHGVLFKNQKPHMNLAAEPEQLTTDDMPVPTCATCHMSGLEGENVTHNVSKRLSWYLFADVSEKRDHYQMGQDNMQAICMKCHTEPRIKTFYDEAEQVLHKTNDRVQQASAIMQGLREDGLLTDEPFDEPIEFLYFDYWHYYGRTAKHGAFMGGADFVQWHGNYELVKMMAELKEKAHELRAAHGQSTREPAATQPHAEQSISPDPAQRKDASPSSEAKEAPGHARVD